MAEQADENLRVWNSRDRMNGIAVIASLALLAVAGIGGILLARTPQRPPSPTTPATAQAANHDQGERAGMVTLLTGPSEKSGSQNNDVKPSEPGGSQ